MPKNKKQPKAIRRSIYSFEESDIPKYSLPVDHLINKIIYFLIKDSKIVYVGQSCYGINRLINHKVQKEKSFDSYTYIPIGNDVNLSDVEAYYIAKFKPVYNLALPPNTIYRRRKKLIRTISAYVTPGVIRFWIKRHKIAPAWRDFYDIRNFDELGFIQGFAQSSGLIAAGQPLDMASVHAYLNGSGA